jgi:hypothetical protein
MLQCNAEIDGRDIGCVDGTKQVPLRAGYSKSHKAVPDPRRDMATIDLAL